jgi:hypothetical protein
MAIIPSTETQVISNPKKFAIATPTKLLTRVSQPPVGSGKGRKRNPVITAIYAELLNNRNEWFHVNIPLTDKKQVASLRAGLYARAAKDNLATESVSRFNDETKMFDFWVMLTH